MLVQLVDAGVHRTQLDNLRRDLDDEARVRRAAGRRKLSVPARAPLAYLGNRFRELAFCAEEGLGAQHPGERVLEAVLLQDRLYALRQRGVGARGRETEVEVDHYAAGDDVADAGTGVDIRHLPGGRRKAFVAPVPLRLRQL